MCRHVAMAQVRLKIYGHSAGLGSWHFQWGGYEEQETAGVSVRVRDAGALAADSAHRDRLIS